MSDRVRTRSEGGGAAFERRTFLRREAILTSLWDLELLSSNDFSPR